MNPPKHRWLWALGGLCAAFLFMELIALAWSGARWAAADSERNERAKRLAALVNRPTHPSRGNLERLAEAAEDLAYRVGELEARLDQAPFPPDAAEAADFSARAQRVIERFNEKARASDTRLPETLEVGFAEYASGGAVPETRFVPRLSRQLYSVESVADALVGEGVLSIDALSREVFEDVPLTAADRRARARRGSSAGRPAHLTASFAHPEGWFYVERVGVSFTAREDAVWRVLDRLASAPRFMVVAEFAHQTRTDLLAYDPEASSGSAPTEAPRFSDGEVLVGEQALSRPERLIAGEEIVAVRLVVDVYNFNPEVER